MRYLYSLVFLVWCVLAQAQDPFLEFQPVTFSGLTQPIDLTNAGDGSGRLFINEKGGRIKIFASDRSSLGTFLDISGRISSNGERGFLGLAFSPDYPTSGRFYTSYTNPAGNSVISRWSVSAADPNLADAASEEILLTINQPFGNHNGGDLAFGNDGLLYIASGDGGSGNDPEGNSQYLDTLLGKILRIDVSPVMGYAIPPGNYTNADPEVYAAGMRNPWRMSFDPVTGELYIGDVGQGAREEVDIITPGQVDPNFGWVCWEGTVDNRGVPGADSSDCQGFSAYDAPWYEYETGVKGRSITGGLVYRGSQFPDLVGYYVMADYTSDRVWAIRGSGASQEVYEYPAMGASIVGFGTDEAGEAYAVGLFGQVFQLTTAVPTPVELISFSATTEGCDILINWQAAAEIDFSHYELEISPDAVSWTTKQQIAGGGGEVDETGQRAYTTRLTPPKASTYLRLKMVDLDGSVEYSPQVFVEANCGGDFRAYPSPLKAGETLRLEGAAAGSYTVYDALGRKSCSLVYDGATGIELSDCALATGLYFLRGPSGEAALIIE